MTVNDGFGGGNYAVTYVANTTSTINPAALTVTALAQTKVYDGTTNAAVSASVNGVLGQDVVSVVGGSGSFADANAGSGKSVAISGYALTGLDAANYNVVQPASVTATIHKADLILSGSKTYDGSTAAAGGTRGGAPHPPRRRRDDDRSQPAGGSESTEAGRRGAGRRLGAGQNSLNPSNNVTY